MRRVNAKSIVVKYKIFFEICSLAVVSTLASSWIFHIRKLQDLLTPVSLAGDGLFTGFYIKIVGNLSWSDFFKGKISSFSYGWPSHLDYRFYPSGNFVELFLIKSLKSLNSQLEISQLMFIFQVIRPVLSTFAAYLLISLLIKHSTLRVFFSIAYGFSSFEIQRGLGHFFIGFTWALPLALFAYFITNLSHREDSKILSLPIRIRFSIGLSLMFICGLSGFYIGMFSLLILFLVILSSELFQHFNTRVHISSLRDIESLAYSLGIKLVSISPLCLGIVFQLLPSLLFTRGRTLTGIGERSPIEPWIYSGNWESLFLDMYRIVLHELRRDDLVAFLISRASWEGSQVGLIPGLFIFCVISLFPYLVFVVFTKFTSLPNKFLLLTFGMSLFFSLTLYFPLGINSVISYFFLRPIRAWGRMSIVITCLCLILITLLLNQLGTLRRRVFTILLSLILAVELNSFAAANPSPSAMRNQQEEAVYLRDLVLGKIIDSLGVNCTVMQLPLYPHPEFDYPNDSNIDYSYLELPYQDNGKLRWSSGAIKSSANFSPYQSFISEYPPFPRASLLSQLYLSSGFGSCGSIVDRTLLNSREITELEALQEAGGKAAFCFAGMQGKILTLSNRYLLFTELGDCPSSQTEIEDLETNARIAINNWKNNLVWRFDAPGEFGFVNGLQYFSSTNIPVRFIQNDKLASQITWLYQINAPLNAKDVNFEICAHNWKFKVEKCVKADIASNLRILGISSVSDQKLQELTFTIKSNGSATFTSWTILPAANFTK